MNIHCVKEMQTRLVLFVKEEIRPPPVSTDTAFYPTLDILRSHMTRARNKIMKEMSAEEKYQFMVSA